MEENAMIFLEIAQQAIKAALTCAESIGIKVSAVIMDSSGHVIASARMDGARWVTMDIAKGKAYTAAAFGRTTRELSQRAKELTIWAQMASFMEGRVILGAGGLPILIRGSIHGGVGISGATGDQDEQCARAAADLIVALLK